MSTDFVGVASAGFTADHPLALNEHNRGGNVGIATYSGFPSNVDERGMLQKSGVTLINFNFNVSINKKIVKSWLYIYTVYYDEGKLWTVELNDEPLVSNENSNPVGDDKRQIFRFDNVSRFINKNGPNGVRIRINDFGGTGNEVDIDGATLVVVYEDSPLREYWIYEGTEYLEGQLGSPQEYTLDFTLPEYTTAKNAELIVAYHNYLDSRDELSFNGHELSDDSAEKLVTSNYIHVLKFDVKDLVDGSDSLTFGAPYQIPIYPSLAILSVETLDVTPPVVDIIEPEDNSIVTGNVEINGSVDDPTATISLLIDAEEVSNSTSYLWNTSAYSEGQHEIKITAVDPSGNSASKSINVNVDNSPPSLSITAPQNGSSLNGSVDITGTISDSNLDTVSLKINGSEVSTTLPYSWDTIQYPNENYTIELTASDKVNNTASTQILVTVDNAPSETPPPTTTPAPTTTPPPTTLPPSTTLPPTAPPETTLPPQEEIDLGIQILSVSPETVDKGENIIVKLMVLNYGDKKADSTVTLYIGDGDLQRVSTERLRIGAKDSKTLELTIKTGTVDAVKDEGLYRIKTRVDPALGIIDPEKGNNEDITEVFIKKKSRISERVLGIAKWLVLIVAIAIIARIILLQMSPERDYLR